MPLRLALLNPAAIALMSSLRASRARATTSQASAADDDEFASVMIRLELRDGHACIDCGSD